MFVHLLSSSKLPVQHGFIQRIGLTLPLFYYVVFHKKIAAGIHFLLMYYAHFLETLHKSYVSFLDESGKKHQINYFQAKRRWIVSLSPEYPLCTVLIKIA